MCACAASQLLTEPRCIWRSPPRSTMTEPEARQQQESQVWCRTGRAPQACAQARILG